MTEEQNKNELPEGWKWQRLEDALDFVIGGDWGKDENFNDPNYGDAYCIRGAEIKNWNEEKGRTASLRKIKLSNIEKRRLIEGDILVEISGGGPEQPVGRTVLIDKSVLSYKPDVPKICTNFLRLIRPKDFVESKFLDLYLKLFYHSGEIVKYQAGSNNLRNLKFPDYVKINFPLPPKDEQQQIVSKIEELFSELDKGIEELKTAQQQSKVYRQAVLKWAFEGKLTNENVKDGEFPEGWRWEILSEVSDVSGGLTKNSKRESLQLKLPFLRVANVYFNEIDLSEVHTIGIKETEIERVKLVKDDLLFVEGNGSLDQIGRVALWNGVIENCVHQNHLIKARLTNKVIPKYALYFFLSTSGRERIKQQANSTSGLHTLSLSKISKLELPICSIEEQQQIVQEIESRLSVCDKIEETINDSLKQAEALRKTILKKAFEGKLISI